MLDARLLRAFDRLRLRAGLDRGRDPLTGRPTGMLSGREAVAAGWATIGRGTYGRFTVNVGPGDRAHLTIGAYTSIAEGVEFVLGGNHRSDWVSTYPFRVRFGLPGAYEDGHPRPESDMRIGSDVWLGRDAMIAPGVEVGDGAVVGARAIVTRDVRPYAIVVGPPRARSAAASTTSASRRCCASAGGRGPRPRSATAFTSCRRTTSMVSSWATLAASRAEPARDVVAGVEDVEGRQRVDLDVALAEDRLDRHTIWSRSRISTRM